MSRRVRVYDTTLRDGAQAEGINFSLEDSLRVALRLDEFGVDYIEGGWPGSNPKAVAFFERIRDVPLKHARVAAFGSTRRARLAAEDDPNLRTLLESGAPVLTIFGKSWDLHVTEALRVTLAQNLEMIADSIRFLKAHVSEVIYDAEHFFDGYRSDPEYALATLQAAEEAGADCLVLCDTNGGTLPGRLADAIHAVRQRVRVPFGIHAHNDSEMAVANSVVAVELGASHVQGTINGFGERCGNANLCSVLPILELKLGLQTVGPEKLRGLTELSNFINEVANMPPNDRQPFVGRSAFAHKGGVHADAMLKNEETYEHLSPEAVGNTRKIIVSELAGGSSVQQKAKEFGVDLTKDSPVTRQVLQRVMDLENEGYSFESAEGSLEVLVRKAMNQYEKTFDLISFRVTVEKRAEDPEPITEATLKLRVNGHIAHTVAEGDGPVHALDNAMRKALQQFVPHLADIRLTDFKVRVINVREGTAAKVRVLVESADSRETWNTIGVSTNIIEASWQALVDAVDYAMMRERRQNST
ncbi:MAG: citramalate synthase [Armatimonadetes bacterium]|nr:citramalate synthase [Armatimonadota bacterium]